MAVETQPGHPLFLYQCTIELQQVPGFRGRLEGIAMAGIWVEGAPGSPRLPFASNDPGQLLGLIEAGA